MNIEVPESASAYMRHTHGALLGGALAASFGFAAAVARAFVPPGGHLERLLELGHAGIAAGVIMGACALLAMRGRSIEEAWRLAYDLGFERGYREGSRTLLDESVAAAVAETDARHKRDVSDDGDDAA